MDGNHPKDIDPRPKRRRAKDNPYEIYTVGIHTDQPHYFIAFTDYEGIRHEIEIDKVLFETLNRFELDDLSYLNEVDNHYERSELTEASLSARAFSQPETVEEIAMQHFRNEQLHRAIAQLPEKQRTRLILYYFGELTYEQIAEMEGCKYQTVQESIYAALKKLKKILS